MSRVSKILTVILIFNLILGQFSRVPGFLNRLYFFDLFSILFASFSVLVLLRERNTIRLSYGAFVFLLFSMWAGLSLIRSTFVLGYPDLPFQLFYLVRWVVYLICAFGIISMIWAQHYSYSFFLKSVLVSGFVLSIAGFIQLFLLPDFTVLDATLGWDPHKNRLASTFFDPNFVGAYLVITLSIYLGLLYTHKLTFFKNYFSTLCFFVLPLLALFLTFSRSAWAMFAIVILVYGVLKYRLLLLGFMLMCFLIYFAVPRVQTRLSGVTDPADSAHYRLESWGNAYSVFKAEPAFGVGFNAYRYAQIDHGFFQTGDLGGNSGAGADSSGLLVLATTGIIGFCLFWLAYILGLVNSFKFRKSGGIIGFSILIALMFESVFINSLFYPQILLLWLVLVLLPYGISRFDISH